MPIYEYACEKCGKQKDVLQKVEDPPPESCEACGAKGSMTKQVSRTSFVLKGGGWYSDLYGSSRKSTAEASSDSSSGSKSDTSNSNK